MNKELDYKVSIEKVLNNIFEIMDRISIDAEETKNKKVRIYWMLTIDAIALSMVPLFECKQIFNADIKEELTAIELYIKKSKNKKVK